MEAYLEEIFRYLQSGGLYYLLIGAIAFFESLALIGIFVPGSVLIVFAGFLAANGKGELAPVLSVAIAGSIAGDLISYWLGARMGGVLRSRKAFRRRQRALQKAEIFFVSHGGKSVLLGRFVGVLRPFIPFVAGGSQMRPLPFCSFALVGGALWGLGYPGLGYLFGESWKKVELWSGRFSLVVAILIVLAFLAPKLWSLLRRWRQRDRSPPRP
jgi:undecaprenyl-diphosphatase